MLIILCLLRLPFSYFKSELRCASCVLEDLSCYRLECSKVDISK
jgi:hypothetical protein